MLSMLLSELATVLSEQVADRLHRSHGDLGTTDLANLQETNDTVSSEEDGQEGGRSMKTFQRDLSSADQKVESARKMSSPLKKKRRRQR